MHAVYESKTLFLLLVSSVVHVIHLSECRPPGSSSSSFLRYLLRELESSSRSSIIDFDDAGPSVNQDQQHAESLEFEPEAIDHKQIQHMSPEKLRPSSAGREKNSHPISGSDLFASESLTFSRKAQRRLARGSPDWRMIDQDNLQHSSEIGDLKESRLSTMVPRTRINPTRMATRKRDRVANPPIQIHQSITNSSLEAETRLARVPSKLIIAEALITIPTTPVPILVRSNYSIRPDGKADKRCPKSGITTIENPEACDKYFRCEDGFITERTCPNGLFYGTVEPVKDSCVYRWEVSCGDRPAPNPISSPGCLWQNGVFMVQGSSRCSPDYHVCNNGLFRVERCEMDGEVYDDRIKSCLAAELAGCGQDRISDFLCPPDDKSNPFWPYPRYFFTDHAVINCINGRPKLIKCRDGERVDSTSLHCGPAESKAQMNKWATDRAGEEQEDEKQETRAGRDGEMERAGEKSNDGYELVPALV